MIKKVLKVKKSWILNVSYFDLKLQYKTKKNEIKEVN